MQLKREENVLLQLKVHHIKLKNYSEFNVKMYAIFNCTFNEYHSNVKFINIIKQIK